jgi:multiple sugar transport system ATP-binding protein
VARIVLDRVSKVFGKDVVAVHDVSMEVGDGEFMVLVGPSGCGKSTLLRVIAGLEDVTAGEVAIGDRIVTDLAPRERDVAMVFQNYALYPHMSVEQNIGIGLKLRHMPKPERRQKVAEAARVLGLEQLLDRRPGELSGGQRQRVAIGRAMVRQPQAFLMDEPLSNLDAKLRVQMRAELARLRDRLRTTTVYVTHDQVEAMTLGDRVAVMKDGVVQQLDTPRELYWRPANLFVAAFIGSPSMNLVEATVQSNELRFGSNRLPVPAGYDLRSHHGATVALGIRPSDFSDAASGDASAPGLDVRIEVAEELGAEMNVLFTLDAKPVVTEDTRAVAEDPTDEEPLLLVAGDVGCPCTARLETRGERQPGDRLRLTVDAERLYLFDLESGEAIAAPAAVPASAP